MKKFNLTYITDEVLVGNNAPTTHVLEICRNLNQLSFSVRLITSSLSSKKINDVLVKHIFMSKNFKSLIFHPLLSLYLIHEILAKKISILYVRYFPLLTVPILVSRLFKIPSILEVNGKVEEETELTGKHSLSKIYKLLGIINMRAATKIISVTEGIKKYIIDTYKIDADKIFVIENGINLSDFKPISRNEARIKTNLKSNSFYLGYVGSFYTYQGINHIISSATIVHSKFPNVKLVIIGNGPMEEKENLLGLISKLKASDYIEILGPIDHARVSDYINAFDICICYPTSFRDNATSPFKLFEYLALKKLVICSEIGGLKEYFKDSIIFVKPDSPRSLAKKIIELVQDNKLNDKLEKSESKFILKNHTWRKVAERINDILLGEIEEPS